MTSRKAFIQFIRALAELLEAGISVRQALETIQVSAEKTKCGRFAGNMLRFVLEGYPLSSAFQLNTVIAVDRKAVSVLAAAEKTGELVSALRFLSENEDQREETAAHLTEVALYPVFVLCVAGIGTAVLLRQYRLYSFASVPDGAFSACLRAALFLLFYLLLFCLIYGRIFSQDSMQLFFYETGYLLSSGLCMTDALHVISGFCDRKTALPAELMLPEIRSGVPFAKVFRKAFPKLAGSDVQLFLDLASESGNLGDACNIIWKRLKKKADARRQLALRLAEPVLLTGTGMCLLILLEGAVLPFLTQFGGVL